MIQRDVYISRCKQREKKYVIVVTVWKEIYAIFQKCPRLGYFFAIHIFQGFLEFVRLFVFPFCYHSQSRKIIKQFCCLEISHLIDFNLDITVFIQSVKNSKKVSFFFCFCSFFFRWDCNNYLKTRFKHNSSQLCLVDLPRFSYQY